jgi:dihydrofolate reductase
MKKILIAAITLDGKIAQHKRHNVNWTSRLDKQFFRAETKKAGVVVFGANTYKAIGGPMPDSLNIVMTREPKKFASQQQPNHLEFTSDSPRGILDNLRTRGYTKVIIGGGAVIYSLFLQAGLIDEIYLTIAPKIFGRGINLFKDVKIKDIDLELMEVGRLGKGEILLKYKIKE